jgi:hypothetical protein
VASGERREAAAVVVNYTAASRTRRANTSAPKTVKTVAVA